MNNERELILKEPAPVIIGSNIQKLGERLATLLDCDDFNNIVEYLDAINEELQARATLQTKPVAEIDTKKFSMPYLLVNGKAVNPIEWVLSFENDCHIYTLPPSTVPLSILNTIGLLLNTAMNECIANGADSVSMPSEYVELAMWLSTPHKAIAEAAEAEGKEG